MELFTPKMKTPILGFPPPKKKRGTDFGVLPPRFEPNIDIFTPKDPNIGLSPPPKMGFSPFLPPPPPPKDPNIGAFHPKNEDPDIGVPPPYLGRREQPKRMRL